jgi:hypothetical protein
MVRTAKRGLAYSPELAGFPLNSATPLIGFFAIIMSSSSSTKFGYQRCNSTLVVALQRRSQVPQRACDMSLPSLFSLEATTTDLSIGCADSAQIFCLPQHKDGHTPCSSSLPHLFLHSRYLLVYLTPTASSILFCASYLRTMACDSTYCAPPKVLSAVVRTRNPALPNTNIGDSAVTCGQDTSCQSQPNVMANACHGSSAKCTPQKNGCYSSKSVDAEAYDLKRPSCCQGKLSPCCDSSCIDQLALRECATESESSSSRALQSATDLCILQTIRQAVHPQTAPVETVERRADNMSVVRGINTNSHWKR